MSWWRSDDWQDVIADSADPAVARLALTAAAGRSIGYDALADAAETPAVVYAYNRAGADADYASDVIAALDVYDRTTTALMAAGMPSSVAESRAALVFGIPAVDGRFLEVAKQPAMPSDVLVASADEALARAFAHLVQIPEEVLKADEPWDESEVVRDDHGRFAPEGRGAQQAYRVVDGRKVAISSQVQTSQQAKREVQEVTASSTDEQMLADLARRNEEQRQFAAAKRSKRLRRLDRLRGAQTQQREQLAQREQQEAARQAAEQARIAEQKTTGKQLQRTDKAKVLSRRQTLKGMSREQALALREQREQERKARADERFVERMRAVRSGGPGPRPFSPSQFNVWEAAGYDEQETTVTGQFPQGQYLPPGFSEEPVRIVGVEGVTLDADDFPTLLIRTNSQIVDGQDIVNALLTARKDVMNNLGVVTSMGLDVDDTQVELVSVMDQLISQVTDAGFPPDALVHIAPYTYAAIDEVVGAVKNSNDVETPEPYVDENFPVFIYDPDTGMFNNEVRTVRVPSWLRGSSNVMAVSKADESWDETEVVRDQLGRFAPEGHREAVVGGRKVLVKVEQGQERQRQETNEVQRSSTDTQDLAWVADRNRQAAMRRMRLSRLRQTQRSQREQRAVQPTVQQAEAKSEQVAEQRTQKRLVLNRRKSLKGMSRQQYEQRRANAMKSLDQVGVKELEAGDGREVHTVINANATPIGRALRDHALSLQRPESGQAWSYALHITSDDAQRGLGEQIAFEHPRTGRMYVIAGSGAGEGADVTYVDVKRKSRPLFLDPDSLQVLNDVMPFLEEPANTPLLLRVEGAGTLSSPFVLSDMTESLEAEDTTDRTEVRELRS